MNLVVLRERQPGEARVALMPDAVRKLVAQSVLVQFETGAGLGAARSDDDYREAGAQIVDDRTTLLETADILPCVNRPDRESLQHMKSGAVVVGFLKPL